MINNHRLIHALINPSQVGYVNENFTFQYSRECPVLRHGVWTLQCIEQPKSKPTKELSTSPLARDSSGDNTTQGNSGCSLRTFQHHGQRQAETLNFTSIQTSQAWDRAHTLDICKDLHFTCRVEKKKIHYVIRKIKWRKNKNPTPNRWDVSFVF